MVCEPASEVCRPSVDPHPNFNTMEGHTHQKNNVWLGAMSGSNVSLSESDRLKWYPTFVFGRLWPLKVNTRIAIVEKRR